MFSPDDAAGAGPMDDGSKNYVETVRALKTAMLELLVGIRVLK